MEVDIKDFPDEEIIEGFLDLVKRGRFKGKRLAEYLEFLPPLIIIRPKTIIEESKIEEFLEKTGISRVGIH